MNNIKSFEEYKHSVNEAFLLTSVCLAAVVLGSFYGFNKWAMETALDYQDGANDMYGNDKISQWLLSKLTNKRVARIMMKLRKDPEYQEMLKNREDKIKVPTLYLDDLERFKSIMERLLDKEDIEYMNAICSDEGGKLVSRVLDHNGNLTVKDSEGKTVIYFDVDENYNVYSDYALLEIKSDREIVKDLARRLSFDKDVIKYLNTSRAKRTMGWRELLATKLHGKNLDYINYLTKTMVADYNPQITGYIKIEDDGEDFDVEHEEEMKGDDFDNMSVKDQIADLNDRVSEIEDVLAIDKHDEDTAEVVKKELDLETVVNRELGKKKKEDKKVKEGEEDPSEEHFEPEVDAEK